MSLAVHRLHNLGGGRLAVEVTQDVEPYLAHAQRYQMAQPQTADRTRWAERRCTIPLVVIEMFLNKFGLDYLGNKEHRAKIERIIMTDPDYKYLRTSRARPLARRLPPVIERNCAWEAVGVLRAVKETAEAARGNDHQLRHA